MWDNFSRKVAVGALSILPRVSFFLRFGHKMESVDHLDNLFLFAESGLLD